jgi:hypothetical protein
MTAVSETGASYFFDKTINYTTTQFDMQPHHIHLKKRDLQALPNFKKSLIIYDIMRVLCETNPPEIPCE